MPQPDVSGNFNLIYGVLIDDAPAPHEIEEACAQLRVIETQLRRARAALPSAPQSPSDGGAPPCPACGGCGWEAITVPDEQGEPTQEQVQCETCRGTGNAPAPQSSVPGDAPPAPLQPRIDTRIDTDSTPPAPINQEAEALRARFDAIDAHPSWAGDAPDTVNVSRQTYAWARALFAEIDRLRSSVVGEGGEREAWGTLKRECRHCGHFVDVRMPESALRAVVAGPPAATEGSGADA